MDKRWLWIRLNTLKPLPLTLLNFHNQRDFDRKSFSVQSNGNGRIWRTQLNGRVWRIQLNGRIWRTQLNGRIWRIQLNGRIWRIQLDGRIWRTQLNGRIWRTQLNPGQKNSFFTANNFRYYAVLLQALTIICCHHRRPREVNVLCVILKDFVRVCTMNSWRYTFSLNYLMRY
jgi:hypothetical protein